MATTWSFFRKHNNKRESIPELVFRCTGLNVLYRMICVTNFHPISFRTMLICQHCLFGSSICNRSFQVSFSVQRFLSNDWIFCHFTIESKRYWILKNFILHNDINTQMNERIVIDTFQHQETTQESIKNCQNNKKFMENFLIGNPFILQLLYVSSNNTQWLRFKILFFTFHSWLITKVYFEQLLNYHLALHVSVGKFLGIIILKNDWN